MNRLSAPIYKTPMYPRMDRKQGHGAQCATVICKVKGINFPSNFSSTSLTHSFHSKVLSKTSTPGLFAGVRTQTGARQIVYTKFQPTSNPGVSFGYIAFNVTKMVPGVAAEPSFNIVLTDEGRAAGLAQGIQVAFNITVHVESALSLVRQEQDYLQGNVMTTPVAIPSSAVSIFSPHLKRMLKEGEYIVHEGSVYVRQVNGRYKLDTTAVPQTPARVTEQPVYNPDFMKDVDVNIDTLIVNSPSNSVLTVTELLGCAELDMFHASFEEERTPRKVRMNPHRYKVSVDASKDIQVTGRKRALLVGCNYVNTEHALNGAVDDQTKIGKILQASFGYSANDVMVMNDFSTESPTKSNILRGIQWLIKDARAGDCLWFSFSGHGLQVRDHSGDEADGMDEAIMPINCRSASDAITDDEIFTTLIQPLPEGVKLTGFFDCCHSGSVWDLGWKFDFTLQEWTEESRAVHAAADVVLISGCRDNQQSQDVAMSLGQQKLSGGALTLAFCSELIHNFGKHSYITLVQQMLKAIHKNGFTNQCPMISSSQPFDVGRPFNVKKEICPNLNRVLGPTKEMRTHLRHGKAARKQVRSMGRAAPTIAPMLF